MSFAIPPQFVLTVWDHADWGRPFIFISALLTLKYVLRLNMVTARRFVNESMLILFAFLFYAVVRGLVQGRESEAHLHAGLIIQLEQALGIYVEPQFHQVSLQSDLVVRLMNLIYAWCYWPFVALVLAWLFLRKPRHYGIYRNAVLISGTIGLMIFALFPVAPPRFIDGWGFVDTVKLHAHTFPIIKPPALTNEYAAVPSFHFGWTFLLGLALYRHATSRAARAAGVIVPFAMFWSIILTANHFFLDALAGGVLVLAALGVAVALNRRIEARPSSEPWSLHPANEQTITR